jgi:hypothetical protein
MKRTIIFFLPLLFSFVACKNKDKQRTGKSENNIDAARNFIRAALDGKFNEARTYLVTDSINSNWMDVAERSYQRTDQAVKDGYRSSSINIHQVNPVNDSTAIIIYSNSFKNDHDTLKVLKMKGQWLVDFKYLYGHDADTLQTKTITNDAVK